MGIPSYFSYIVKHHLNILRKLSENRVRIDNLYMDCNSIIYDAVYKLNASSNAENIADEIIAKVICSIEENIYLLKPSNTVFIAFDGVAPVAKLEQQRSRRFKSQYINKMTKNILKKDDPDSWNTAIITPGTNFMKMLDERIKNAFLDVSKFDTSKIIFSGSNEEGEGEHKIFDYIRKTPLEHDKHKNTVIYGLDADLIMLSINHLPISPNIYLFRETPEFIKSINVELEPNEKYLLDIPELANTIIVNMNNGNIMSVEKQNNTIYDYILMCFMLGNDFMPHFPAINIRTGGIDKLLNAYKEVIGGTDQNLTDGKKIHWCNMRKFIKYLAENERHFLKQEHKQRDRRGAKQMNNLTAEASLEYFTNMPTYERSIEKYINPFKDNWQVRYYSSLFDLQIDEERTRQICVNYLEGLEWTMKYYTSGCPDWRWTYKYNYPPLLEDLIDYVPFFDTELMPCKQMNAVSSLVQLCYVLPRQSLVYLHDKLYKSIIREKLGWYNTECEFHWAYCKYFWESHPDLPNIDMGELEKFVEKNV